MIARMWRGAVRGADGDAYTRYLEKTGLADYAGTPGNLGVTMLRREVGDRCEFVLITLVVFGVEDGGLEVLARERLHGVQGVPEARSSGVIFGRSSRR